MELHVTCLLIFFFCFCIGLITNVMSSSFFQHDPWSWWGWHHLEMGWSGSCERQKLKQVQLLCHWWQCGTNDELVPKWLALWSFKTATWLFWSQEEWLSLTECSMFGCWLCYASNVVTWDDCAVILRHGQVKFNRCCNFGNHCHLFVLHP